MEHGLTGRSFLEAATAQQSFPRLIVRDHNRFRLVAPALDRDRSFTSWKGNSSQSQYLPKSIKNHERFERLGVKTVLTCQHGLSELRLKLKYASRREVER